MAVPIDVKCPSCGAPLAPPIDGKCTCAYCERTVTVERRVASIPVAQHAPPRHSASNTKTIVLLVTLTTTIIAGYTVITTLMANKVIAPTLLAGRGVSIPDLTEPRMLWDDVGGPPVPVKIEGNEAVLGRLRTVTTGDQLFIVASDSATLKKRWKAGPFGTYSEGYQSTHVVVVGDRVAISDFHSKLHFLDLKTGKELASMDLSDRVECMVAEKGRVRARQVDKKSLLIDPANQSTMAILVKTPRFDDPTCKRKSIERKSMGNSQAPSVDGFESYRVLIDGDEGIAAGKKSPGTPIPHVVGFEPKTKRVLWRQVLPSVDPNTVGSNSDMAGDLAGHRYVGVYPVGSEIHRVTAFDARNGARLWDVKLKPIFAVDRIEDMVATEQFVYVVRTSSLDVLEAKSGKLIGAIGDDTYDKDE